MIVRKMASEVAVALLALVLLVPGGAIHAQQPSPAAMALAKELIAIKGAAAIFEPVVVGIDRERDLLGTLAYTSSQHSRCCKTEVAGRGREEHEPDHVSAGLDRHIERLGSRQAADFYEKAHFKGAAR